jgi:hypothetical protein
MGEQSAYRTTGGGVSVSFDDVPIVWFAGYKARGERQDS